MSTPESPQKPPSQGGVKKFFSVVFLLLFIMLGPSLFYATIVQRTILSAEGIKTQSRRVQIGENAPQLIGEFFAASASQVPEGVPETGEAPPPVQDPFAVFGGREQFEQNLAQIWPPADVYLFLDDIIDTTFSWWQSGNSLEELPLVLNFASIKERLKPIIISALEDRINNLPVCSEEELASIGVQKEGDIPNVFEMQCRPEGFTLDEMEKQGISKDMLAQMVLISIYDEIDVGLMLSDAAKDNPEQFEQYNLMIMQARQGLDIAALSLRVLQFFVLFCVLMLVLLNFSSRPALFRYLGWTFFLCGLFILMQAGFLYFVPDAITITISAETPQLADFLPGALAAFVWTFIQPAFFVGGVMFLLGILFFYLRHFTLRTVDSDHKE